MLILYSIISIILHRPPSPSVMTSILTMMTADAHIAPVAVPGNESVLMRLMDDNAVMRDIQSGNRGICKTVIPFQKRSRKSGA